MLKLTLREKVEFWRENKIWLKKINSAHTSEEYGMLLYGADNGSVWGVEKVDEQTRISQISMKSYDDYSWSDSYKEMCNDEEECYIFGKKGIFYTKGVADKWECIYSDENITGMQINSRKQIVIIFKENRKDEVYRITNGVLEPLLKNKEIIYENYNKEDFSRRDVEKSYDNMKLFVRDDHDIVSYYFITADEVHDPKIRFKNLEKYKELLNGQVVQVYSEEDECSVLATMVEGRIKKHYACDKFVRLGENHYLAKLVNDSNYHFLKYVSNEEILDLGVVPGDGKYSHAVEILGVHFYTFKNAKGMMLLAVNGNKLESKFYEGAINIKASKPVLFENSNIVEIKPVVVFEEVIENK